MRHRLLSYPSTGQSPQFVVEAQAQRAGAIFLFRYRVVGRIADLVVPPRSHAARIDGLWRSTCFEAFIRPGAGEAYIEINFSPSTQWAAYHFTGYRQGMCEAQLGAPLIGVSQNGRLLTLEAAVNADDLGLTPSARAGLTAVLEDRCGARSYWALAHHGDKPDFHRADGFIARLPGRSHP